MWMQIVYNILCIIWNVMEADKEVQILKNYLGANSCFICQTKISIGYAQPDLENI